MNSSAEVTFLPVHRAMCSVCEWTPGFTSTICGEPIPCPRCNGSCVMPALEPPCAACGMYHDEPLRSFRLDPNDDTSSVMLCGPCWHGDSGMTRGMVVRRMHAELALAKSGTRLATPHTCCDQFREDDPCAACATEDPEVVAAANAVSADWDEEYSGYRLGARRDFFKGVEVGRESLRKRSR